MTATTAKAPKGWGLEAPEGAAYHWSARTIFRKDYHGVTVDLVWDRKGIEGEATDEERAALVDWIDRKGLPYLRAYVALDRSAPYPSDRGEIEVVKGDGFVLRADPKGSRGYLYLSAAPDPTATGATPAPAKPRTAPKRKAPAKKSSRDPWRLSRY